jgi:GT2 family glycosyltransferase
LRIDTIVDAPDHANASAHNNQYFRDLVLKQASAQAPHQDDIVRTPCLISVIIVNFNAGDYLRAAVNSVLSQEVGDSAIEIVVVDNHSTDGSTAGLQSEIEESPDLRIICLDENIGFARACNVGLQVARGDLLLFLNPDCRILPGAIAALRDALLGDADAGMAGARLINPDGSEQRGARRDIPNPWLIFCEVLQLHRLMTNHPRFRSFNLHADAVPENPVAVPAVSGACMMVRRDAIAVVGQFDGDYFLHFEDLDWCLRFNQANCKILFVPDALVEHTLGVCSLSMPVRVAYEKHRSLIRFLRKHFTAYYPSSFMALVSALVTARFLLLAPRVWLRAHARPRTRVLGATRLPVTRQ